jgi:hypothetical protein
MSFQNSFVWKIIRQFIKSAIVVFFAVAICLFLKDDIAKTAKMVADERALVAILGNKNEAVAQLKADFKNIDSGAEEKMLAAAPPVDNILNFSGALESASQRLSLLSAIGFESPQSVSDVNYNVAITNGNIFTLIKYLKEFESLPYYTGIKSVALQANEKSDWTDNSKITIIANLKTRPPAE